MIGDGAVGCTALWLAYSKHYFYTKYIPTVFDYYEKKLELAGELYDLVVYDTAGQEDYDRLRPIGYLLNGNYWTGQQNKYTLQRLVEGYDQLRLIRHLIPKSDTTKEVTGSKSLFSEFNEDHGRARHSRVLDMIDACIVVFSVGNPDSYANVKEKWIPEMNHYSGNVPIVLVGNKTDHRTDPETLRILSKRKMQPVTTEMGEQLAQEINAVRYVECSCRTGMGIKNVFEETIWAAKCHKLKRKLEKLISFINLVFVGNENDEINLLIQQFIHHERLSIFGYRLNSEHYIPFSENNENGFTKEDLYRFPGDDYSAFIEIDGEVHGLRIVFAMDYPNWKRMRK